MTEHFLSPAFVKLYYSRTGLLKPHVMTIPVIPSGSVTPLSDPLLAVHDGSPVSFSVAITSYVDILKTFWASGMSFTHAEFWSQPTPDDDPLFIYDVELGVAGTAGGSNTVAVQHVITFRTAGGSVYKVYLMEDTQQPNSVSLPPLGGGYTDLVDAIVGDEGFIFGRDNTKPVAVISAKTKTNDALRRKYITG